MSKEHDILIEAMQEQAETAADTALWRLLEAFKDELPALDGYFHKAFRQIDIVEVGEGHVDMAIWTLISDSDLFWKLFPNPAKDNEAG